MKKIVIGVALVFLAVSICGCTVAKGQEKVVLGEPTALKLVIVPNGFKLTWKLSAQDPGAVTGYEIVRSAMASGPFDEVAVVAKGISEYIDKTAKPEIYYYKVRAAAGSVYSAYSNTVTGER